MFPQVQVVRFCRNVVEVMVCPKKTHLGSICPVACGVKFDH